MIEPEPQNPRKVLVFLRAANYDRVFECLLREMLDRGCFVDVVLELEKGDTTETGLFEVLGREYDRFSFEMSPRRTDSRYRAALTLRYSLDYLRYLEPEFRSAHALRARARKRAPRAFRGLARTGLLEHRSVRASVQRNLERIERSVDVGLQTAEIRERAPDAVVVSPLIALGSPQTDYVRAARAAAIPSVLVVASWDNLTNKGRIRAAPDLVVVWNEAQRQEAIALHGIAPSRVVAVGAHSFDHWFSWQPSRTRAEFLTAAGLDADQPYVLYLCSSAFIAGNEGDFVSEWASRIRTSELPALSAASLLIRPHPQNPVVWLDGAESDSRMTMWPREGSAPSNAQRKNDYFDSLFYAGAVVGINTSAMIEAAIVRKPVHTILVERFKKGQQETLHFAHLAGAGDDGLLRVANSWEEHFEQLEQALIDPVYGLDQIEEFLSSFVRPAGLATPAAPLAADAILDARLTPEHEPEPSPAHRLVFNGIALSYAAQRISGTRHRAARSARRAAIRARRTAWGIYDRRYRRSYIAPRPKVPSRLEIPELLNRRLLTGTGVEIGVKKGAYSRFILDQWRGIKLISVDPWLAVDAAEYVDRANVAQEQQDVFLGETRRALGRYGSRSEIWRMTSLAAASRIPDASLDFVYIDARHDYASVLEDIDAWFCKLRPGGIMAGHDYADGVFDQGIFGVKRAVDEFFGERSIPVTVTDGPTPVEMFPSWLVVIPPTYAAPGQTPRSLTIPPP